MKYDPKSFEKKWQNKWFEDNIYAAVDLDKEREKYYVLVEFPYPSGEGLHIGHTRNYSMMDSVSRLRRMMGYNVMYPMGWDAFGLPAENYAIKTKQHPRVITDKNTSNFKSQMMNLGLSFDWQREIDTTDTDYYKWTQWIFLQFFKKGLAFKDTVAINWCPSCKTGCANEEVVDGLHERCEKPVEKRDMSQWLLKITEYADRLADELDMVDFPESAVASQRNWIGRKEWIDINYPIDGMEEELVVSTTRPDTNFGATFIVISPEHPILSKMQSKIESAIWKEVEIYVEKATKKSEAERMAETKEKTGVFTGLYCTNRLNNKKLPIYVSDFVLMSVGTGAVVGVPGHDMRDFDFAKAFAIEIVRVVVGEDGNTGAIDSREEVVEGEGTIINSEFLDGLSTDEAIKKVMDYIEKNGWGKRTMRYHLRDWIFSRQHYWGEPIPIIHCDKCGMVPVPEEELPVKLPDVEHYEPTDDGRSPLANITDWVKTKCPNCGGGAERETDTMPNWAGSSWYFLRYCDPKNDKKLADIEKLKYWMPVDIYDGGAEHTTLHLLYSRFWHKFLNDIDVAPGKEPYAKRRVHGVVLGEGGKKMSKSLGNVINPDELVEKYGADSTRTYVMFMGPYDGICEWNTRTVVGVRRFLERFFEFVLNGWDSSHKGTPPDPLNEGASSTSSPQVVAVAKLANKVQKDIIDLKFNTAIASMMEFLNENKETKFSKELYESLMKVIAPFAPHMAEELWEITGHSYSIHKESWPVFDSSLLIESEVEIPVTVNARVRSKIIVAGDAQESEVRKIVEADENIRKYTEGKSYDKFVYVKGKIVNIVVK